MPYEEITWECDGRSFPIGLERAGAGPTVLLLPALSSISTRREMQALQERLARSFSTVSIDWPGFGDLAKPRVNWRPEIYQAYLNHLLTDLLPTPAAIIAAGHAAGYVIRHCAEGTCTAGRLVLLSPTWRGPLPTMMGGDRPWLHALARAVDPPVMGSMLYRLNVNRLVVGMMARGHVYANPDWLDQARMDAKLGVTLGARRAPRFDPVCRRSTRPVRQPRRTAGRGAAHRGPGPEPVRRERPAEVTPGNGSAGRLTHYADGAPAAWKAILL